MKPLRALAVVLLGLAGLAGCGGGAGDPGASRAKEARPAKSERLPPVSKRSLPDPAHTSYFRAAGNGLDPPLREGRTVVTHAPIGAPPVIANGVAYVVSRRGYTRIVSLDTGHVFWGQLTFPAEGRSRELTAPVADNGQVFIVTDDGYEIAMGVAEQEYEWSFDTNAQVDAPPITASEITYFIANRTTLIALNEGNLHRTRGLGVVTCSPSYDNRRLFVANRGGSVISIGARRGAILWRADTGASLPSGEAGFSLAPAVALGHVYAARGDGAVVALDEKSGELAWHARVEGAPESLAVAGAPGTPAAVYVVSRQGRLDAFDARSGKRLWRYDVGKPVVAPMAVVGHTAFVSTAGETLGIDVRTARKAFRLPRGRLTPVGADRGRIYLAGDDELVSLEAARG